MNMPAVCGEAAATAAIAVLRLVPGSGRVPFTAAGVATSSPVAEREGKRERKRGREREGEKEGRKNSFQIL